MKFRKQTSYNSHDSSLIKNANRLTVKNGVKQRCELIINRLIASPGLSIQQLTDELNYRFKEADYKELDIVYAMSKLLKEDIIYRKMHGVYAKYYPTLNLKEVWRSIKKEMI